MAQQLPPQFTSSWEHMNQTPPPSGKRTGVSVVIALLVLALSVAVILNESLLQIKSPKIEGNERISAEEVAALAGFNRPVGYFSVNESKIKAGVENNRYLIYEKIEKVFPDKLTIFVRERRPLTLVQEMGAFYNLDDQGMVLERYAELPDGAENMIMVTGAKPKELRLGRMIVMSTASQLEAYRALLEEFKLQGYTSQVSELIISDPESISIVTRSGYTVHLGDISSLRAKIGTVRAVEAKLLEMNNLNGFIEAATPGEAVYSPVTR